MKNELLTIGPVTIYGYGLMIAIGVIFAYSCAEFRAKKKGMNYDIIFNLTIWCLIGGIIGAKLLYYITQFKSILEDPSLLLDIRRGFVVFGGIIGGIFTGYLFIRRHKLNFLQYFDLVMPSIALAQGFGRIGCLLAGCCYGAQTTSSLHIVFHNSDYAPNGLSLIPTQPISSILNFLNFFALIIISRFTKADGQVAGFYLTFYSAGRFIIEFFRGDLERGEVGPLSTSQFIAIFTFAIGLAIIIICGMYPRKAASVHDTTEAEDKTEHLMEDKEMETAKAGTHDLMSDDFDNNSDDMIIELLDDSDKQEP